MSKAYFQVNYDSLPVGISNSSIAIIPITWSNTYLYYFAAQIIFICLLGYIMIPLSIYYIHRLLRELKHQLSKKTIELHTNLVNTLMIQVFILYILFGFVFVSLATLYFFQCNLFGKAL